MALFSGIKAIYYYGEISSNVKKGNWGKAKDAAERLIALPEHNIIENRFLAALTELGADGIFPKIIRTLVLRNLNNPQLANLQDKEGWMPIEIAQLSVLLDAKDDVADLKFVQGYIYCRADSYDGEVDKEKAIELLTPLSRSQSWYSESASYLIKQISTSNSTDSCVLKNSSNIVKSDNLLTNDDSELCTERSSYEGGSKSQTKLLSDTPAHLGASNFTREHLPLSNPDCESNSANKEIQNSYSGIIRETILLIYDLREVGEKKLNSGLLKSLDNMQFDMMSIERDFFDVVNELDLESMRHSVSSRNYFKKAKHFEKHTFSIRGLLKMQLHRAKTICETSIEFREIAHQIAHNIACLENFISLKTPELPNELKDPKKFRDAQIKYETAVIASKASKKDQLGYNPPNPVHRSTSKQSLASKTAERSPFDEYLEWQHTWSEEWARERSAEMQMDVQKKLVKQQVAAQYLSEGKKDEGLVTMLLGAEVGNIFSLINKK